MSILSFLFKSKRNMAKKNTKRVRMGKYTLTSHVQNRLVEKGRRLRKKDMLINLFGNSKNSSTYRYKDGTVQYDRVSEKNRTITHITNNENNVKSINRFHDTNTARKQIYKNFDKEEG